MLIKQALYPLFYGLSMPFSLASLIKKTGQSLAIQVKRYTGKVGIKAVQEIISGTLYYKANKAIVATNSFYTGQAIKLAKAANVTLIDRTMLINLLTENGFSVEPPLFSLSEYEKNKTEIRSKLTNTFLYCPLCNGSMSKISPKPKQKWKAFLGCDNYAKTGCKGSRSI